MEQNESVADLGALLVAAAARGDVEEVRRLLNDGADINSRNERGSTPLQIAAHFGKEDVVRELLRHDPDLTPRANDGWRALTSAAANTFKTATGRTRILALLLEHGDRPASGNEDWKALHYAAQWGNEENVTLLTSHGMDPDMRDPDGLTPLMRAARAGRIEAVKALLAAGADANASDGGGQTALDLARARKKKTVVAHLSSL